MSEKQTRASETLCDPQMARLSINDTPPPSPISPPPPQDPAPAVAPPVPPRPARVDPANPVTGNTENSADGSGSAGPLVEGKGGSGLVVGGARSPGWEEEEEEPEVVEELPLPELYVPGRIVHIYRYGGRGVLIIMHER